MTDTGGFVDNYQRNQNDPAANDILDILAGDAARLGLFRDHAHLLQASKNIPEHQLILKASAVKRVLTALLKKEITTDQAQAWASFVRRGYIHSEEKAVTPLYITYENSCEDLIAEAVSRLDELGDIIDGTISDDELRELIQAL